MLLSKKIIQDSTSCINIALRQKFGGHRLYLGNFIIQGPEICGHIHDVWKIGFTATNLNSIYCN